MNNTTETKITEEEYGSYIRFLVESTFSIAEIPDVEFSIKKSDGTFQTFNLVDVIFNVRKNGNVTVLALLVMLEEDIKKLIGKWIQNQKEINKMMVGWEKLAD